MPYTFAKTLSTKFLMAGRKKENRLIRATVSLDPHDYKEMDKLAQKSGLSTAWLIRKAMREFLERYSAEVSIDVPIRGQVRDGRN